LPSIHRLVVKFPQNVVVELFDLPEALVESFDLELSDLVDQVGACDGDVLL
jgi:hypothetical protein